MIKVTKAARPHSTNRKILEQSAAIYRKSRTPEVKGGRISELDVSPGGPGLAAKHLIEIHQSFGNAGVRKTVTGLQVTRGNQFVAQMIRNDAVAKRLVSGAREAAATGLPASVKTALSSRESGAPPHSTQREMFRAKTGIDPGGARLFNNERSHRAAAAIGARAFTVGNRIFFGKGQYDPTSVSGKKLLFHEMIHTHQQRNAMMPPVDSLRVSGPRDPQERQADQATRSMVDSKRRVRGIRRAGVAKIQRQISFTTNANKGFITNNMGVNENAAGFQCRSATPPTFWWQPDVTIHGSAGDPFADWEVAHHQVTKSYWNNIWWGFGANRTRRRYSVPGWRQRAQREIARDDENAPSWLSLRSFHAEYDDLTELRDAQQVAVRPESISFEIRLDATDKLDEGDAITGQFGIAPQLATLELMVHPKEESLLGAALGSLLGASDGFSFSRAENPPMILFIWGLKRVLPVNINSINITETEFSTNLDPIRATVSVSLTVIEGPNLPYTYSKVLKEVSSILNLANIGDIANVVVPG